MIWGNAEIRQLLKNDFPNILTSIYDKLELTQYSYKGDVAKFYILQKYGGCYVDIDVKCVKPIETEINLTNSIPTIYFAPLPFNVNNSIKYFFKMFRNRPDLYFIISPPNHILWKIFNKNISKFKMTSNNFIFSWIMEGVFHRVNIREYYKSSEYINNISNVKTLRTNTFVTNERHITKNTIGVHYYENSWVNNKSLGGKIIKYILHNDISWIIYFLIFILMVITFIVF